MQLFIQPEIKIKIVDSPEAAYEMYSQETGKSNTKSRKAHGKTIELWQHCRMYWKMNNNLKELTNSQFLPNQWSKQPGWNQKFKLFWALTILTILTNSIMEIREQKPCLCWVMSPILPLTLTSTIASFSPLQKLVGPFRRSTNLEITVVGVVTSQSIVAIKMTKEGKTEIFKYSPTDLFNGFHASWSFAWKKNSIS